MSAVSVTLRCVAVAIWPAGRGRVRDMGRVVGREHVGCRVGARVKSRIMVESE